MFKFDLETLVKNSAKEKGTITIPEIQQKFGLKYKDALVIVRKLCDKKFMELGEGIEFRVCADSYTVAELREQIDNIIDDGHSVRRDKEQKLFLRALAYCIYSKEVTLSMISEKMNCGTLKACMAANWMLNNNYVVSVKKGALFYYKAVMTKAQFVKKYGKQISRKFYLDEDDSEELLKKLYNKLSAGVVGIEGYSYKWQQVFNRKKVSMSKNYTSMFDYKFDMGSVMSKVPDMDKRVNEIISRARNEVTIFGNEWYDGKPFEALCMEVIEYIVGMNSEWRRADAVLEAAREVVAVEYGGQSKEACNVHSRVLYELLDGSDEDYERVKKIIWG